jgi:hypothetical protein
MKLLFTALASSLLAGCAVSASVGLWSSYSSGSSPTVDCFIRAHEYLPHYGYIADENLPKRAVLVVMLDDHRTSKPVLRYERKLRASPRHLDFTAELRGDIFAVHVSKPETQQKWIIEFLRSANGKFGVTREIGDFIN